MANNDAFSMFEDISPKKQEPTLQVLYDYEKHYMELIKQHKNEIVFIENMLKDYRQENIDFFNNQLSRISQKLDAEHIDKDMKNAWLKRLEENMNRSFAISEKLITDYTTKKLDEFKTIANEKLRSI
ncbi:hypothetical protein [Megamonas funiformis]|jgi:hypothetical protein|uniref:hypothetical protein n=1 Tax=Megamonas funiformis TaxID=437897 RepID=UPI0003380B7E|nr:hypothetical protein [Megamonas funiformis]CDB97258.1 conserved domain protein [Megamonas funiformis CAG:377]